MEKNKIIDIDSAKACINEDYNIKVEIFWRVALVNKGEDLSFKSFVNPKVILA
jgi:hypothetical protein